MKNIDWTDLLINIGMIACYVLMGIGVLALIASAVFGMAQNKISKMMLIAFGSIVVILFASYLLAPGNDISIEAFEKANAANLFESSKLIGASLYAVYAFAGIALLSLIVTECLNFFKK